MGKTSQQSEKIKLPPEIKEQALANLALARQVGELPYAPNFGLQVAAFTPTQEAAFGNTNSAASAFGLPSGGGTGLPPPQTAGGFSGYSTRGLYENSMAQVPQSVLDMYEAFFGPRTAPTDNPVAQPTTTKKPIHSTPSSAGKKNGQFAG